MAYGTIKVDTIENTNGLTGNAIGPGFKNRIINGAMVIDQRNAGASVNNSNSNVYILDRWITYGTSAAKFSIQQNAGSVTPPAGFSKYMGFTSLAATTQGASDYYYFAQPIEGQNLADLAWGTASAKTVTLSFWVRSSLTGTFSGVLTNNTDRTYPFTFTVNSATTWEQKSITIPGDTTGTWLTTNGVGIYLYFNLGSGSSNLGTAGAWAAGVPVGATGSTALINTNGATFYITGVQLEVGPSATSFDYRPYGTELALCQRYYYKASGVGPFVNGYNMTTTTATGAIPFPVPLRTSPTALEQTGTAANYRIVHGATVTTCSAVPYFEDTNTFCGRVVFTVASGLTAGQGSMLYTSSGTTAYLAWSAEL